MFEKWKRRKRKPRSMKTLISREMNINRRNIYVGTQHLELVNEKDFHAFLVIDSTDKDKWIEGAWECDAFALNLLASAKRWFYRKYKKNVAVGLLWRTDASGQREHALNFMVTPEYKVRYFEPQSDKEVHSAGRKLFVLI